MSLIPAPRRQRQADLCGFKASLAYRVSSRTVRTTQRTPVLKKPKPERRKDGHKEGRMDGWMYERKKGWVEGRKEGRKAGKVPVS